MLPHAQEYNRKMITIAFLLLSLFPGISDEPAETGSSYKWDSNLELSYIRTSGNTNNETLASKFSFNGTRDKNSVYFKADYILQKSNSVETGNELDLDSRYERKVSDKLFLLLESKYERNEFSGYGYRFSGGPGIGYNIINGNGSILKAFSSLRYHLDRSITSSSDLDRYLAVKIALNGAFNVNEYIELKNDFDYTQSTSDVTKKFINNESAVRVKINSIISIGLRYKVRYESQPALTNLENMSTTFLSSLVFHW
jgi:putative salt-induced outer membrane protein